MATKKKRPSDINLIAKQVVDEATPEQPTEEPKPPVKEKDLLAVELGRRRRLKGGKARAKKLSPEDRKDIAKKAAQKRWSKK